VVKKSEIIMLHPDLIGIAFYDLLPVLQMVEEHSPLFLYPQISPGQLDSSCHIFRSRLFRFLGWNMPISLVSNSRPT
jgi:hypothetical protein